MGALGGVDSRRKPMYFSRAKMRRVFDISIMLGITIPLMSLFDRPSPYSLCVVRYRGKDIEQSADLTSCYERPYPHRAAANL